MRWGDHGLGAVRGPVQGGQGLTRVSLPGQVRPEEPVAPRETRRLGPCALGTGGEKNGVGVALVLFSV